MTGRPGRGGAAIPGHPGNIERLTGLVATAARIAPQVARPPATAGW